VRIVAEVAARRNSLFTIVVTWNDRLPRLIGCAADAMPFTVREIADSECESASRRAREFMQTLTESAGVNYCCRKGRPHEVARQLAREDRSAVLFVSGKETFIERIVHRFWRVRRARAEGADAGIAEPHPSGA
jgi:hypothetical protein